MFFLTKGFFLCIISSLKTGRLHKKLLLLFLLITIPFILLADTGISEAGSRDRLIQNVVTAYGGKDTLSQIESIIVAGEVDSLLKKQKGVSRVTIKYPDRLRVETKLNGSHAVLIFEKNRGWKKTNGDFIEVKGPSLKAVLFSFRTIYPPLELLSEKNVISYLGLKKGFEVLEISDREKNRVTFYIDPETFLIKRAGVSIPFGRNTVEIEKEYGNFKSAGSVLYPYTVISYANGTKNIHSKVKEVLINSKLDDTIFKIDNH